MNRLVWKYCSENKVMHKLQTSTFFKRLGKILVIKFKLETSQCKSALPTRSCAGRCLVCEFLGASFSCQVPSGFSVHSQRWTESFLGYLRLSANISLKNMAKAVATKGNSFRTVVPSILISLGWWRGSSFSEMKIAVVAYSSSSASFSCISCKKVKHKDNEEHAQ